MTQLSLEQRIDRLESIEAIRQLKYTYCHYCDIGYKPELIASLFSDDAIADYGSDYNVGPEQVANRFRGEDKKIPFAAHLVANPIISVDGDTGHGTWWIIMPSTYMVDEKPVAKWFLGEYEEDYVRIGGQWKFKTLKIDLKFLSPHLEDWSAAVLARIGTAVPGRG